MCDLLDELIPCFVCDFKHVSCFHPEKCEKLETALNNILFDYTTFITFAEVKKEKLLKNMTPKVIQCPYCGSKEFVKKGCYTNKNKITWRWFRCKSCGKGFNTKFLKGFQVNDEIIKFALLLNEKGKYSSRDIANKIKKFFNVKVSHVTVSSWVHNNYLKEKLLTST